MKHRGLRLGLVVCLLLAVRPDAGSAAGADPSATAPGGDFQGLLAKAVQDSATRGESLTAVRALADGAELRCDLQKLSGRVTPDGLQIESRSAGAGHGSFTLRLSGCGRGDPSPASNPGECERSLALCSPGPGQVSVAGNRVTSAHRSGFVVAPSGVSGQGLKPSLQASLTEEFTTSGEGIRHDLVLATPPAGTGEVRVELRLDGATASASASGARLRLPGGRELTYDQLHVTDADGRVLPARMSVSPCGAAALDCGGSTPLSERVQKPDPTPPPSPFCLLAIAVDDTHARYPVRIDPTISDANWRSMGGPAGADGGVYAAVVTGTGDLVVGGFFSAMGGVAANRIAKWDGSSWSALGSGIGGGVVFALAVSGSDLYVGGSFAAAGGVGANNAARWNGSSWFPLGSGTAGGAVRALAVSGSDLYVGGDFTTAGGGSANRVAKWDGSSWSTLGTGMNAGVHALAVAGTDLYASGEFTTVGGTNANYIAKWNGSAWSALGSGMNNGVYALAVSGTNLYAGGYFTAAGLVATTGIAKWDGSSWSALGSGMNFWVKALAVSGTDLYAGGYFTTAGGGSANYIAKWDGSSWSALGSGMDGIVRALAVSGPDVYAGGEFSTAGGGTVNYIAKWSGGLWSVPGASPNGAVYALAISGTDLYAGGEFARAGGANVGYIAKWNGSSWSALGTGMNSTVRALAVSGTDLYAGGQFSTAGGGSANCVAKWNGSSWSALGSGMDGLVRALVVSGTDLYAGGYFATAGGVSVGYIARWNGSSWSALDSGMNMGVTSLAISDTNLYVGGFFTTAGGVTVNRIAKWNGSAWSALGSGMNNAVEALATSGADLYAGGQFTAAGGTSANYIAKWDGSSWAALGSGMGVVGAGPYAVALAVSGTDLYAGGMFTTAGGGSASRVAKWDGSSWAALGSGLNSYVYALAASGTDLYAGGYFTTAGGKVSAYAARLDFPPSTTVATTATEPTATSPIPVTITFGEPVTGFDATDLTLSNATYANFGGSGASYSVDIIPTAPGAVTVAVAAGVCLDGGSSGNTASNTLSRTYAPLPTTPTTPGVTAMGTDTLTWTWTDASNNETGFKVWDDPGAAAPTTLRTTTAAGATSWQHNGLAVNTQYAFQVAATNAAGDSAKTATFSAWTLANAPTAPTVSGPTVSTLDVAIGGGDGNPAGTEYALQLSPPVGGNSWVQADGSGGAAAVWRTAATWATTTVTGLASATTYSFTAQARNGAAVATALGPAASGSTSDIGSWSPLVSNVTVAQRPGTKRADIGYDLAAEGPVEIGVRISADNGATWTVPAASLTGNVGAGIAAGTGKAIVWDGGTDWDGQHTAQLRVEITATAPPPPPAYVVIDLSGGPAAASYPVESLTAVPAGGWTAEHKTTKLVLRRIPKTSPSFTMGSPAGELGRSGNETQHEVTLTQDFYIGVFEITQKQWERVMGDWPSYFNNVGVRDTRPVELVSYDDIRGTVAGAGWPGSSAVDATSFMGKLRQRTGLSALDLPTESQWEYACRAGTTTALNNGTNLTSTAQDANLTALGRYSYNGGSGASPGGGLSVGTAGVGSYLPNAWGLCDMHGNVWEWCLDWYGIYPGTVSDPPGAASHSNREFRGGSWSNNAQDCRSAYRAGNPPPNRSGVIGLRVAGAVEPLYEVIDLSGGPAAASYPVKYLPAVPAGGWTAEYKTTKLVLRRIPKTSPSFTMGSPAGELGRLADETQHAVTLTQDFYIGVFEVTQKQWNLVMGTWPSYFNNVGVRDARPVEEVSYDDTRGFVSGAGWPASSAVDASSFMGKLRQRTGLSALDLPTESQWEYACRAGAATALNNGTNLTSTAQDANLTTLGRYLYNGGSDQSQTAGLSGGTAAAGTYLPNAWGLYDMHGNVWEWCLDWYGTYPGTVTDPAGAPSGSARGPRGGGADNLAFRCRSGSRVTCAPSYKSNSVGVRIARPLP